MLVKKWQAYGFANGAFTLAACSGGGSENVALKDKRRLRLV